MCSELSSLHRTHHVIVIIYMQILFVIHLIRIDHAESFN